jgi:hypothetical protein
MALTPEEEQELQQLKSQAAEIGAALQSQQRKQDSATVGAQEEPSFVGKVWGDVKDLASGMGNFLGKSAENAANINAPFPAPQIIGAGKTIVDGLTSMPGEDAWNVLGRGGVMTAAYPVGALLGGPAGGVVTSAAGAQGWDNLVKSVQGGADVARSGVDALASGGGLSGAWDAMRNTPVEDLGFDYDALRRDIVQMGVPLAATSGASKIMGKLASTVEPWATKSRPPVLNERATVNAPENADLIKLGGMDRDVVPASRKQRLEALQNGDLAVREFNQPAVMDEFGQPLTTSGAADIAGRQFGILDSVANANKALLERWRGHGEDIVKSGVLNSGSVGKPLFVEAHNAGEAAYKQMLDAAAGIDQPFAIDTIRPALDKVEAELGKFSILKSTEGIPDAAKLTIEELEQAFAKRKQSNILGADGKPIITSSGGISGTEMLDMTRAINKTENEIMAMFSDENLVNQLRLKSPLGPVELEASAKALSSARDSIYEALGNAVGDPAFFKANATRYGSMQTLKQAVRQQELMQQTGLSPKATNRLMQTQGDNTSGASKVTMSAMNHPFITKGLDVANQALANPGSPTIEAAIRARQQPAQGMATFQETRRLAEEGVTPNMIYKDPAKSMPARIGRGANTAAEAADLVREKVGMIDAPGVATLRALMPVRDPVSEQPKIPRQIKMLSPQVLGQSLIGAVEPYNVMPVLQAFQNVWASGDKAQLGNFMAALTRRYPTLPIEKGPLTGLASEIVREDGNSYISDPMDVMNHQKWLDSQDESVLPSDEKAIRVQKLNTTGQVFPLAARISPARAVATPQISNQTLTQGYGR